MPALGPLAGFYSPPAGQKGTATRRSRNEAENTEPTPMAGKSVEANETKPSVCGPFICTVLRYGGVLGCIC